MLKQVQTNYFAFGISKGCHTSLAFSRVSHVVIPDLIRDLVLILSENGGPLTDNAVFISVQRFLG